MQVLDSCKLFVFQALYQDNISKNRGVVLLGSIGYGKTAVLEQMLEFSCFGRGIGGLIESSRGMYIEFFHVTYSTGN